MICTECGTNMERKTESLVTDSTSSTLPPLRAGESQPKAQVITYECPNCGHEDQEVITG